MAALPPAQGLIVILEGQAVPSLRRIAKSRCMSVLEADLPEQVFEAILRLRPRVVIVQVGQSLDSTLRLIRLVATAARPVRLIATAIQHAAEIEQAVRGAGTAYYLPSTEADPLVRLLDAVLVRRKRG